MIDSYHLSLDNCPSLEIKRDSRGLTWNEDALANSSRQLWNLSHLLWTYQPSDVNWIRLNLLKVSSNVKIFKLNSLLLRFSSEGEEVTAVSIGVGCVGRILTIVQNVL